MPKVLEQPSITVPAPVLCSLTPSSTVEAGDSHKSYDDNQQSHEVAAAASMTQNSNLSSLPQKKLTPYAPSHRRSHTEIIPRQSPPLSKQVFADQSKTLEDLDHKGKSSHTSTESSAKRKFEEGARLLADWFHGKSEPVNSAAIRQPASEDSTGMAPTQEPNDMERRNSRDHFTLPYHPTSSLTRAQKRLTPPSPLKQVTTANRFSFFGLKRQDDGKLELPEPADDEFLNLDITAILSPTDSIDMSYDEALDVLRSNADSALRRLQAAYKQRTFALHEAMAEKNEKQEELEEARTRAGHLKTQLDGMAEKVLQQEKAMKVMAEELEHERQMRRKEDEARRRSATLVKASDCDSISDLNAELQTPKKTFKRASNCTFTSDSGFESGDESIADSVFSRRDCLDSPVSLTLPSPNLSQITLPAPVQTAPKEPKPATRPARQWAYDKVLKGLASSSLASSLMGHSSKCTICHGVPASEAWSVLGILKEENHGLKERLSELENAVDDCLCLIGP